MQNLKVYNETTGLVNNTVSTIKMDAEEAKTIVEKEIEAKKNGFAVIDEYTKECDSCWVIIYQPIEYLTSRDFKDTIVGHGPVIVDKKSGEIFKLGSGNNFEECLDAYKQCGDPFATLTNIVQVRGWREGANKVKATKHIKSVSGMGLKQSKHIIDMALENEVTTYNASSIEDARKSAEIVDKLGFNCIQLWSNQTK